MSHFTFKTVIIAGLITIKGHKGHDFLMPFSFDWPQCNLSRSSHLHCNEEYQIQGLHWHYSAGQDFTKIINAHAFPLIFQLVTNESNLFKRLFDPFQKVSNHKLIVFLHTCTYMYVHTYTQSISCYFCILLQGCCKLCPSQIHWNWRNSFLNLGEIWIMWRGKKRDELRCIVFWLGSKCKPSYVYPARCHIVS